MRAGNSVLCDSSKAACRGVQLWRRGCARGALHAACGQQVQGPTSLSESAALFMLRASYTFECPFKWGTGALQCPPAWQTGRTDPPSAFPQGLLEEAGTARSKVAGWAAGSLSDTALPANAVVAASSHHSAHSAGRTPPHLLHPAQ